MKTEILVDFQVCISRPLNDNEGINCEHGNLIELSRMTKTVSKSDMKELKQK